MIELRNDIEDPQEAAKQLQALKERAQHLADALKDVADWLGMACTEGKDFDPNVSFWAKSSGSYANIRQDEKLYRSALDYDHVVDLVQQIISVRKAAHPS
jgi:hypothetical protein